METHSRNTIAVILAAGKGTRMKSEKPKVLHTLMGKPMVSYVIEACKKAKVNRILLVVGYQSEKVRKIIGPHVDYVEQTEQLGTGHALMTSAKSLKNYQGDILVLAGDTPFLTGNILSQLMKHHKKSRAAATLMTAKINPPPAYGRIVRDESGNLNKIVEERDATPEEKKITEVNTSHYCFQATKVFPLLDQLQTDNDQGEYYLTDVIRLLSEKNEKLETLTSRDPFVLIGINSRAHLVESQKILGDKIKEKWLNNGVTIFNPDTVTIEPDVQIGQDTIIQPFTILEGKTKIGSHSIIGPHTKLSNARIGNHCKIEYAVIENRKIQNGKTIGPFAYITGN